MKPETKLRLRKWALMALRSVVWHVDEWLHAQEVQLREDLAVGTRDLKPVRADVARWASGHLDRHHLESREAQENRLARSETFQQWEARRSGIAVVSKKEVRRRRHATAAEFDMRFAR